MHSWVPRKNPDVFSSKLVILRTRSKGNTVVAARPIRRGELLISENPVAVVPLDEAGDKHIASLSCVCRLSVQLFHATIKSCDAMQGFQELCSNVELRRPADKARVMREASKLQSMIEGISYNTCVTIVDKVLSNVFTVTGPEMNPTGVGLYLKASKLNHSCNPNAAQSFSQARIIIRSARDIRCGEEVNISYIDVGQPTVVRRHELLCSYQFFCTCSKCCILNQYEGYKCVKSSCSGICFPELDLSVLKFKLSMNMNSIQPSPRKLLWHHQLPFVWDMDCIIIRILSDEIIEEIEWHDSFHFSFRCSCCQGIMTLKNWIRVMNELVTHRKDTDKSLCWLKKDAFTIRSILHDTFYIVMESLNALVLALIRENQFEEALSVSLHVFPCFLNIYPSNSIIIAIQAFQYSKLLSLSGFVEKARLFLDFSIKSLAGLCGTESEIYCSARECNLYLMS